MAVTFVAFGSPRFRDTIDLVLAIYLAATLAERRSWRGDLLPRLRARLALLLPVCVLMLAAWISIARRLVL